MSIFRESNLCNTVCRKTFLDSKNTFPDVRHVVMEEVHKYEEPSSGHPSWFEKAKRLVRQHDSANPGYLWLFSDKSQTDHPFGTGLPPEPQQQPCYRLTRVIGNSGKIFTFSNKYLSDVAVKRLLKLGHDFIGEGVKFIPYSKGKTSQALVLKETIENLYDEGYISKDITVLFAKQDSILDDLVEGLNNHKIPTCDARCNSSGGVVISTVNKYSGLERPVVIVFDIECSIPWNYKKDQFMYSALTRAMVKLIIVRCRGCRSPKLTNYFKKGN